MIVKLEFIPFPVESHFLFRRKMLDAYPVDMGWHHHMEHEICQIVQGKPRLLIGDEIHTLSPGDLVHIGPNLPHVWDAVGQCELSMLYFKEDILDEIFSNADEFRQFMDRVKNGVLFFGCDNFFAIRYFNSMERSKGLKRLAAFVCFLDSLSHAEKIRPLTRDFYCFSDYDDGCRKITQIVEYTNANLSNEIKQADLAALVNMTPQSFSRFFKDRTGRTYMSFVNLMRINRACRMLQNPSTPIGEISVYCGFSNMSNFNRRFHQIKGCTPSQFRKKLGRHLSEGLSLA